MSYDPKDTSVDWSKLMTNQTSSNQVNSNSTNGVSMITSLNEVDHSIDQKLGNVSNMITSANESTQLIGKETFRLINKTTKNSND